MFKACSIHWNRVVLKCLHASQSSQNFTDTMEIVHACMQVRVCVCVCVSICACGVFSSAVRPQSGSAHLYIACMCVVVLTLYSTALPAGLYR